jgi:hypothetical protein
MNLLMSTSRAKHWGDELVLLYRRSPSGKFHHRVMTVTEVEIFWFPRKRWRFLLGYQPEEFAMFLHIAKEESKDMNKFHGAVFGDRCPVA